MIALANSASPVSNATLIELCAQGDQEAWNALVERYGRLVYSIPRLYAMCEADADDVCQNVFVALQRQMGTIRDPERLPAWLITTAHRESWRVSRMHSRESMISDHWSDPNEPAIESAARWEQQQLVREALQHLSQQERELMTALFLEADQPNYETIARTLKVKLGSIGPMRARCFKKLERILIDLGIDNHLSNTSLKYQPSPTTPDRESSQSESVRFRLTPQMKRNCA